MNNSYDKTIGKTIKVWGEYNNHYILFTDNTCLCIQAKSCGDDLEIEYIDINLLDDQIKLLLGVITVDEYQVLKKAQQENHEAAVRIKEMGDLRRLKAKYQSE